MLLYGTFIYSVHPFIPADNLSLLASINLIFNDVQTIK